MKLGHFYVHHELRLESTHLHETEDHVRLTYSSSPASSLKVEGITNITLQYKYKITYLKYQGLAKMQSLMGNVSY